MNRSRVSCIMAFAPSNSSTSLTKMAAFLGWGAIFLLFFFGVNVLRNIGYQIGREESGGLERILPSVFIMSIIIGLIVMSSNHNGLFFITSSKVRLRFLACIFILFSFMTYMGRSKGDFYTLTNTLILPILFSYYLDVFGNNQRKLIVRTILLFFLVNSFLAIMERLGNFHLFNPIMTDTSLDDSGFRSTGLQNHPLNNAFVTLIIMSFLLLSGIKERTKFILFFIGLTAIICFGSRSSLIISLLMIFAYGLRIIFKRNVGSKDISTRRIVYIGLLSLGLMAVGYVLLNTGLGDRIMNHAYFDDSANVRLQAFNIFGIIDSDRLIWGSPDSYVVNVKQLVGLQMIENFWLLWIIKFGIIFTIALGISLMSFLYYALRRWKTIEKIALISCFLIIASTNNSLDNTTCVVSVFIICSYAMVPKLSPQS